MATQKPIGLTKDAGFQIGVRKSLPVGVAQLWAFLLSKDGVGLWFGEITEELPFQAPFSSREGADGIITTLKENSHLRMKWKKPDWEHFSMLQIRVIPAGDKATLSFHQDQLPDENQRAQMKKYWTEVIRKISQRISQTNSL